MNVKIMLCARDDSPLATVEGVCGGLPDPLWRQHDETWLPVAAELVTGRQALSGYFLKFWGRGERFDGNRIEHGCPMVLWAHPGIPVLHWAARVAQIDARGAPPSGILRLVTNPEQPGAVQGGLSAHESSGHVDLSALGPPDRHGGWTVGGQRGILVQGQGLVGLRLQAVARNVRVLWSAVSQAHPE